MRKLWLVLCLLLLPTWAVAQNLGSIPQAIAPPASNVIFPGAIIGQNGSTKGFTAAQIIAGAGGGGGGGCSTACTFAGTTTLTGGLIGTTGQFSGALSGVGGVSPTLAADATSALQAVTYEQLQTVAAGVSGVKVSVSAAPTTGTNVTISSPGFTTLDGVSLTSGVSTLLLPFETTTTQNGVYLYNGSASPLTRISALSTIPEFYGSYVFVSSGTTQGATGWSYTGAATGTIGTTPITFVQTSASNVYTATGGIRLVGSAFDLGAIGGMTAASSASGMYVPCATIGAPSTPKGCTPVQVVNASGGPNLPTTLVGDGTTDDSAAMQAIFNGQAGHIFYLKKPSVNYHLNSNVVQGNVPVSMIVEPGVTFSGAGAMPGQITNTGQEIRGSYFLSQPEARCSPPTSGGGCAGDGAMNVEMNPLPGTQTTYPCDINCYQNIGVGLFAGANSPGWATTFTGTSGASTITVATTNAIVVGEGIVAPGYFSSGTTVSAISGNTVTLNGGHTLLANASAVPVTFTASFNGQLWGENISCNLNFGTLYPDGTHGPTPQVGKCITSEMDLNTETGGDYAGTVIAIGGLGQYKPAAGISMNRVNPAFGTQGYNYDLILYSFVNAAMLIDGNSYFGTSGVVGACTAGNPTNTTNCSANNASGIVIQGLAKNEIVIIPNSSSSSTDQAVSLANSANSLDLFALRNDGRLSSVVGTFGSLTPTMTIPFQGGDVWSLGVIQAGNGNDALYLQRSTDSTPTGYMISANNAAGGVREFSVDVNGTIGAQGNLYLNGSLGVQVTNAGVWSGVSIDGISGISNANFAGVQFGTNPGLVLQRGADSGGGLAGFYIYMMSHAGAEVAAWDVLGNITATGITASGTIGTSGNIGAAGAMTAASMSTTALSWQTTTIQGSAGVSCSGAITGSFQVIQGIITHC